MLRLDYDSESCNAIFRWSEEDIASPWLGPLKSLMLDASESIRVQRATRIEIPWWAFLSIRTQFGQFLRTYGLRPGKDFKLSEGAERLLRAAVEISGKYTAVADVERLTFHDIDKELDRLGFARKLSDEQKRNVSLLASVPAGATFSVPGAGKTTEALAVFTLKADPNDHLLVIAPKNAFGAWDETLEACIPEYSDGFVRLAGGEAKITEALNRAPKYAIISYQQLTRVEQPIAAFLSRVPVHVFLDESHRIKSQVGQQSLAIRRFSHLPATKLILSGTPMPQSYDDLLPQFEFLYPEVRADAGSVPALMKPVYVRTTKSELNLRPPNRYYRSVSLSPLQSALYRLIISEIERQCREYMSRRTNQVFRSIGRAVIKVVQYLSNPLLISNELDQVDRRLLTAVIEEGSGPKVAYVVKRARQLAKDGNKVIIWSSFVKNVEYLAESLSDLNALYIHGGIGVGDEDDLLTREGKIKRFHSDEDAMVLVANPAAASEGISLHTVCHHAIYLDRTFNAAQYLQSEDRIHRFGLDPDQPTTIEIVEVAGSIDEVIRRRLNAKVAAMSAALEDDDLRIEPIPFESVDSAEEQYDTGLDRNDVEELLRSIR